MFSGTFKTPDILECSGIGNPGVLRQHGTECIVDLPGVGGNLRKRPPFHNSILSNNRNITCTEDHISVSVIAEADESYVTNEILLDAKELEKQQKL